MARSIYEMPHKPLFWAAVVIVVCGLLIGYLSLDSLVADRISAGPLGIAAAIFMVISGVIVGYNTWPYGS